VLWQGTAGRDGFIDWLLSVSKKSFSLLGRSRQADLSMAGKPVLLNR
jgi:hypothetical protein